MIKRVFKYEVPITDQFVIDMPEGGEILDVQVQRGVPSIWALVNDSEKVVERKFRLVGTGHPIITECPMIYVGTFQIEGGNLVFHLFDQGELNWVDRS